LTNDNMPGDVICFSLSAVLLSQVTDITTFTTSRAKLRLYRPSLCAQLLFSQQQMIEF